MKTTFIYFLKDPENPKKGYVGKTGNPRKRLSDHLYEVKKETFRRANWINSLVERGLKPSLEIIDEVPFDHWKQLEVAYIEFFLEQGYELTNGTPGGEDPPSQTGRKVTLEQRARAREARLGKKSPRFGKKHTTEALAKMSAAMSGEKHPNFGKKFSPERCSKMKSINFGRKPSAETRKKMSAAGRNKKRRNTSGFVGVSYSTQARKWKPCFRDCGKDIHVGYFSKLEDAVFARALAMAIHFSK